MLIDFHTHVFPEKIAARALESMIAGAERNFDLHRIHIKAKTEGTVSALLESMDKSGCTHSVLCPVVTNPKSTANTNEFSWAQKSDRLIPFASFIPSQENWREIIEGIAEKGFKGIKLHPEFQNFYVDDPKSIEVMKRAEELGLIVILHAGKDIGYPPPVHATPERLARMLDKVDGSRIVAAHMGGWREWEQVDKLLSGSPLYFDTAFTAGILEPEYCKHLMRNHGTDKILFGSDHPWQTSGEMLEYINSLGLDKSEHEQICAKNAARLLNIPLEQE